MHRFVSKARYFIEYEIWHFSLKDLPKRRILSLYYLKVIVLSIRGYLEDKVAVRASALTFFTLLSIVPVLAMGFGIAQGFGAKEALQIQLKASLEGHEEVFNYIVTFADSMLNNTKAGWMAGVGVIVLLWSVVKVIWNIESSFNHIWQVKKERNYIRKLSDYLSIIVVAPILIITSGSISIYITTQVSQLSHQNGIVESISPLIMFLLNLSPFVLTWLLLTLIYMVMPNTIVKFKSALIAAIIAGTSIQVVQWFYIRFQVGVSEYNAIYGSFAAFPLFLVFLQTVWLIVLFGAEVSFAHQNVSNFEHEKDIRGLSSYDKRLACLTVLHEIVKAFENDDKPKSINEIVNKFGAPQKLVNLVIQILLECGLIVSADHKNEIVYLPACDINKIDISFVLDKINDHGEGKIRFATDEPITSINQRLAMMIQELKKSDSNVLLKDIL